jgi:glycosyltransferase involved in cell wall biosynthesis
MGDPVRVLLDARVRERDGIGRVTTQLECALARRVQLSTLERTEPDLYHLQALENPALAARQRNAQILQLVDFRVPIGDPGIPVVATVHDVFRITDPSLCYPDREFAARYGEDALRGLVAAVRQLRQVADLPRLPVAVREDGRPFAHWEFLARIFMLCCARATVLLTPTAASASEIRALAECGGKVRIVPWGLDHSVMPAETGSAGHQPYLAYVGQARRHKGIDDLIAAYEASGARAADVPVVFVGEAFRAGAPAAQRVVAELGAAARPVGAVGDAELQRIVAGARVLVHLAENEGFGFTPLEALRLGTPVVVRDLAVLRETLGEFGTFVGSAAGAADAIDAMLAAAPNPDWARRARDWAARYTWRRCAGEMYEIYRELTA